MTRRKVDLPADDPRHGTLNGYGNLGCRCERCRARASEWSREEKARRVAAPFERKPHGTRSGYQNWGCRCDECTTAMGYRPGLRAANERDCEEFLSLVKDGLTATEINGRLGWSTPKIRYYAKKLGVEVAKPAPLSPTEDFLRLSTYRAPLTPVQRADRNRVVRLVHQQGFSLREIAGQVNLTHQMVAVILSEGRAPKPRCQHCGQTLSARAVETIVAGIVSDGPQKQETAGEFTVVLAAAIAIYRVHEPEGPEWDGLNRSLKLRYEEEARAALAAADAVRLDLAIPDALALANELNEPVHVED